MVNNIEHKHQVQFIRWCKMQRVDLPASLYYCSSSQRGETLEDYIFAIPNGGKREQKTKVIGGKKVNYSPEGARLKAEGCKAGVHDLFLPMPRYFKGEENPFVFGLFIEVKKPVSKDYENPQVSKEQKQFGERMLRMGYKVAYCWGFNEIVDAVEAYFKGDVEKLARYAIPNATRKG